MAPLQSPAVSGVWRWCLAGALLGFVAALCAFAPARWVSAATQALTQERVLLLDPRGTVWNGSAVLVLTGGPGSRDSARLPGRIDWNLKAGLRQWELQLNASCCTPQALALQIQPGWQRWTVAASAHQSRWPAALLAGLGTPWNTLELQGDLVLQTPALAVHAALDRWTLEGDVQLDALEMGSRLSTLAPLGSYRLHLQGGAQPTLDLSTLRGHMQLSGSGRWTAARLRFEGEARAESPFEAELANLLNIIGRRDGARSVITLG